MVVAAARADGLSVAGYVGRGAVAGALLDTGDGSLVAGTPVEQVRVLQRELFAVRRLLHRLIGQVERPAHPVTAAGDAATGWREAAVRLDRVVAGIDRRLR